MLFRMVVSIPFLESFWQILKWSQVNLIYLSIVTFMVLYMCSIFGKYLFGDDDDDDDGAGSLKKEENKKDK